MWQYIKLSFWSMNVDHLTEEQLIEMLRISNAAAYLVTTKKGAIRSMPNPDEVGKIVKSK